MPVRIVRVSRPRSRRWLAPGKTSGGTLYTKNLAGTLTPAALLIKSVSKTLMGALTPTGAARKDVSKNLAGALTLAGATGKQISKLLVGALTPTGAAVRQAQKVLVSIITPSSALVKSISKMLAGAITPSGALTAIKIALLTLTGTLMPTGALAKQIQKSLGGALASAGTLLRQVSKSLGGTLTPTGALATLKIALISLAGAITPTGALGAQVSKLLAGASALSGALQNQAQKVFAGALTLAGALVKDISKVFAGALTPTRHLTKFISKSFSGLSASSGALALVGGVVAVTTALRNFTLRARSTAFAVWQRPRALTLKPRVRAFELEQWIGQDMLTRSFTKGQQPQGVDEEVIYSLSTTLWGSSPTAVSVKVFDASNSYGDVTATVMPTGSPSVLGDVITLPVLKALTEAHVYRIEVKFTASGNIFEAFGEILAER